MTLSVTFVFLTNPSIFPFPLFPLRGTAVLVLLIFCICFLVACIMYLHITRVQVITAAFLKIHILCVKDFLSSFPFNLCVRYLSIHFSDPLPKQRFNFVHFFPDYDSSFFADEKEICK